MSESLDPRSSQRPSDPVLSEVGYSPSPRSELSSVNSMHVSPTSHTVGNWRPRFGVAATTAPFSPGFSITAPGAWMPPPLRRGSEGVPGSGWGNVGFGVGAGGCLSTSLTPLEGQVHPEHQQHHGSGELSHSQAGVLTSLCLSFLNCQFGANTIHPRVGLRMKGDDVLSREDGIWAGRVGGPKSHPTPGI